MGVYKIDSTEVSRSQFNEAVETLELISGKPLDRSIVADKIMSAEEIVSILDQDDSGSLSENDFYDNARLIDRPELLGNLFRNIQCIAKKGTVYCTVAKNIDDLWSWDYWPVLHALQAKKSGQIPLLSLKSPVYFKAVSDLLARKMEKFQSVQTDFASYQDFLQYLRSNGIRFPERIHTVETALTLIHNKKNLRTKKDPRPIALLLFNTYDWNGAFEKNVDRESEIDIFVNSGKFRVLYYEVSSDVQVSDILAHVTKITEKKIHTLFIAGHGDSRYIRLGPALTEGNKLDIGDFQEGQFKVLERQLEDNGQVVLDACSTGNGNAKRENIANYFSSSLPGRTIHAPQSPGSIFSLVVKDDLSLDIHWRNTRPYDPQ